VNAYDAVVLLGFGGPARPEDIRPFIDRVLNGRPIPQARFEAVVAHYIEIGGASPYNALTRRQADALGRALLERRLSTPVEVAYINAEPFVEDVVRHLAQRNARRIFAIVLAPHQSSTSWDKYVARMEDALARVGSGAPQVDYVGPYFDDPLFVRAHAQRIMAALAKLGRSQFDDVQLVFTAHSIPQAIADGEDYVRQFLRSAKLIAGEVRATRWSVAYQSRSGSPSEPWLGPDIRDVVKELPERGVREAVVAPIGFLCDHVEVLYDLDIDAKKIARDAGLRVERAEALNDHPLFIRMLSESVVGASQRTAAI
jgi:ferrochelatase